MKILALDSATEACSAALFIEGEVLERFRIEPRGHARLLLPMIDELLAEAGIKPTALDALAFGRGPGSFTGLRIAAGIAQGIAYGADIPAAPVSTLATIAQSALTEDADGVMVAIDARMQEVYWGCFVARDGLMVETVREMVCPPRAVSLPTSGRWLALGSGWGSYADELTLAAGRLMASVDAERLPHARDMLPFALVAMEAGQVLSAEAIAPVYLRDQVTHQKS